MPSPFVSELAEGAATTMSLRPSPSMSATATRSPKKSPPCLPISLNAAAPGVARSTEVGSPLAPLQTTATLPTFWRSTVPSELSSMSRYGDATSRSEYVSLSMSPAASHDPALSLALAPVMRTDIPRLRSVVAGNGVAPHTTATSPAFARLLAGPRPRGNWIARSSRASVLNRASTSTGPISACSSGNWL